MYGPGIAQNADEHQCALAQLTRGTAIWASARAVTEEAARSVLAPPVPAVIWVSEPDSFADAIGFWNARALVATITASTTPVTAILLPPDITACTDSPRCSRPASRTVTLEGVSWTAEWKGRAPAVGCHESMN